MRTPMIRSSRFVVVLLATLLSLATLTKAGPPLICHSVEIGAAKSLPWISHDWNLSGGEKGDRPAWLRPTDGICRCVDHSLWPSGGTPPARPESHRGRKNRSASGPKPGNAFRWTTEPDHIRNAGQKLSAKLKQVPENTTGGLGGAVGAERTEGMLRPYPV